VRAFVLAKVEPGKIRDVYKAVKEMRGVSEVFCLTGPDDLIIMLEADDAKKVSNVVLTDLHLIEGIKGTDTRLVVELG
jgi:DNA-binding Lrp family transcriptional regulator